MVQARLHQIGVGIFYILATYYKDVAGGEKTSTAEGLGRSTQWHVECEFVSFHTYNNIRLIRLYLFYRLLIFQPKSGGRV